MAVVDAYGLNAPCAVYGIVWLVDEDVACGVGGLQQNDADACRGKEPVPQQSHCLVLECGTDTTIHDRMSARGGVDNVTSCCDGFKARAGVNAWGVVV